LEPLPGDPGASRIKLSAFVRSHPQSRLADDAAYKLSELAIMQNDMTDAQRWLDWLILNHPRGNRETDARLRLAQLEYEQGNTSAARKLLLPLKFARLSEDQKKIAYRLLANLASSRVSALRWLEQLERVEAATADSQALALTEARIDGVLASASFEDLEGAATKLGDSALGTRIQLAQAQRALSLGKPDVAREAIERARRRIRSPSDEERVRRVQEQLVLRGGAGGPDGGDLPTFEAVTQNTGFSTQGAAGTLGVVLPLTGPFAAYGETSLRGVLLAAGIFDDPHHEANAASGFSIDRGIESLPPGMNIIVRDSGGEPDRAAQAVRELAADPSLVAIIGPLLSRSAEAAAEAAEEEGVPLLAMTRRDEIARERSEVLRLRMSPRDEVGFLVKYAVEEQGARRFAILYPRDSYGRGMRQEFWDAVDRQGGWVVAASAYDPDATDFADPIRNLVGYQLLTPLEEQALEERAGMLRRAGRLPPENAALARKVAYEILGPEKELLPPQVDFDALFIPDSHEKVVLIAPQLAFHEVDEVQLLGSSGWNHPELLEIAREHVKGAVISTPFDPASRFPFVADFVARYLAAYGSDPDVLAAESFDAVNLVKVQLAAGLKTRAEVRQGILATEGYPGVSGVTAFTATGGAHKRPFLLGVERRAIVPLD
jgi:branched-chain amino acid transport system substrate-binding protein